MSVSFNTALVIALLTGCSTQQSGSDDPCSEKNLATVVAFCVARAQAECLTQNEAQCEGTKARIDAECSAHIDQACGVE